MERNIVGKRPRFRPAKVPYNPYRIMLWISLIFAGVWLIMSIQRGQGRDPLRAYPHPHPHGVLLHPGGAGLFPDRQAG